MCNRCADLEEQVAWLKSELGLSVERTDVDKVRRAFGLRPNEAWIVLRLAKAGGRVVSYEQLLDEMPSLTGNDDRHKSNISTHICRIRSKTDRHGVETARSVGLRIGPWLAERLPQVLAA